jgi:hypothetical protein
MHVFVKCHQAEEVHLLFIQLAGGDPIEHAMQNLLHVSQGFNPRREREGPAIIVRDSGGIVETISILEQRFFASDMAQHPVLLEPGDMPDLPEQRIHDRQARTDQLLVAQIRHERERSFTGIGQRLRQICRGHVHGPD